MFNNIKDKFAIVTLSLLVSFLFVPKALAADVTIVGIGDMVCEFSDTSTSCRQMSRRLSNQTSIINPQYVLPLGDLQYVNGEYTNFTNIFDSDWGIHKSKMKPIPGNHEYHTTGAAGYYNYFGTQATGVNGKGYYSWNAGDWHMIALNSEIAISEQVAWLNSDLAANPTACTLAYYHRPRFSSGNNHGSDNTVAPFWEALYARGVDVVLNGHEHNYERFNLQNATGGLDTTRGIREFVVGTGGRSFYGFNNPPLATSQFRRTGTGGILKLILHPTSYDFSFIDDLGNVIDSGSGQCVGAAGITPNPTVAPTPPPAATIIPTVVPCGPTNTGQVVMNTNLPTGVYKIWARVQTSGLANNFYVRADNTCTQITNSDNSGGWIWISAGQTVEMREPNQTVTLIGRDDGVKVDKVILTQNMGCTPTGFGENCEVEPTATPTQTPPGTTIDPTPTLISASPTATPPPGDQNSGTRIFLNPIADAKVIDTKPSQNFGNNLDLRINSIPNGFYREMSRAYLMFDVSSLKANVANLKLRFRVRGGDSASKNIQSIRLVDRNDWTESGINYNNAPALGRTLTTFGPTSTNTWYEITLPIDTITSGQTRLSLAIENCADCRDGLSIDSKETSNKPALIINGGAADTSGGSDIDDEDD